MNKLAFLFVISIFLISCSSSDDTPVNDPEDVNYIIYPNSSLAVNTTENGTVIDVESGDKLVFEYRYTTDGVPEIADDEFTEVVYFEVDQNSKNFIINQENFGTTKTHLGKFCFCAKTGYFQVTSGEIKGEKIGDLQWDVSLDVKAFIEADDEFPELTFETTASGNFEPED